MYSKMSRDENLYISKWTYQKGKLEPNKKGMNPKMSDEENLYISKSTYLKEKHGPNKKKRHEP